MATLDPKTLNGTMSGTTAHTTPAVAPQPKPAEVIPAPSPFVPAPSPITPSPEKTVTTSPAVVTSEPARKQTISNKQQLDLLAKQAADLKIQLDLKAKEEAAAKAEAAKTSGVDEALKGATPPPAVPPAQVQMDAEARAYLDEMNRMRLQMDSRAGAFIQQIENEYAGLIRQQEETNKAYQAGITTEGFRSDRARYAPLLQGQIIKGAIDQGLQKISDLNVKKNRLILEAEQARDERSFNALEKSMSAYRNIVKEEREVAQQTYENAINASKAAREQLKYEMDMSKFQMDQTELISEGIAGDYATIKAQEGQEAADAYLNKVSTNMNLPSAYLLSNVEKTLQARGAKQQTAVLDLAKDYPSAKIKSTDTIEEAAAKVRQSAEYKQDFYKGELAISNTSSLIRQRAGSESIDYSDPVFQIYSDASGQLISSPTTAKAVKGYATSLLAGKEIVSDNTKNLKENQITETQAYNMLSSAFTNFRTKSVTEAKVNEWLGTEGAVLDDEQKRQYMQENFGVNPDDFGIW